MYEVCATLRNCFVSSFRRHRSLLFLTYYCFNIVAQFELAVFLIPNFLFGQSDPYLLNTIFLKCGRPL